MSFPVIRTSNGFTTVVEGRSYTVNKDHMQYNALLANVRLNQASEFKKNFEFKNHVVDLKADGIYVDGHLLHDTLGKRVIEMIAEGFDTKPMKAFVENLLKNPTEDSRKELYAFMEHAGLPITEDGCLIAYKVVQNNWLSKSRGNMKLKKGTTQSGYIYNGVGEEIECERHEVDPDRRVECASGLHVGSLEYSGPNGWFYNKSAGDHIILVKVNPKDVVSVPLGEATKMRVSAYKVLSEYKVLDKPVAKADGAKVASKRERVAPEDLVEDDVVSFNYTNVKGEKSNRKVRVKEVWDDRIIAVENYEVVDDYGYDEEIKTFLFSRMRDTTLE